VQEEDLAVVVGTVTVTIGGVEMVDFLVLVIVALAQKGVV
jgi:hypothetical protein